MIDQPRASHQPVSFQCLGKRAHLIHLEQQRITCPAVALLAKWLWIPYLFQSLGCLQGDVFREC